MQCPQCQTENQAGRRFCGKCGAPLAVTCPDCGFANEPDVDFCGGCGKALFAPSATESARRREAAEPERRQITVMFCDLVGSTALAERLDPEELHNLLRQYQDVCAKVIDRYGGYIARYVGDGLLVYFGYPQAHEDDPQRAVRTGLGIVEAIKDLAVTSSPGIELAVRIGIATGLVVAGDIGSGERVEARAIVGETPNLAARLQALAEPNAVVIGTSTWRLVDGLFHCDDLGERRLKGISQPVRVYRVRAESGAPSRFEARVARGLTPLVGREAEVDLLLKRWGQAEEGEGRVVLLCGEAGIGKSRITRGFQERLGAIRNRVLYYGSPYHQNSALHPIIDQLERALRFQRNDTTNEKLDKLEAVVTALNLPIEKHGPLLASLLSLSFNGRYPPLQLSAPELKNEIFRALVALVGRMSTQDTVLMVVEDAHWIDPSTLELISLFIEHLHAARFLLLITFRPEFESPWGSHSHVTALTLNRLSQRESAAMIGKIMRGKALPDELLSQIIARTDGVPLFIEELTKTVLESGLLKSEGDRYVLAGPLPPLAIPASLQDSLMARLDRLGAVKEVAQLAATCGRTFGRELLLAASFFAEDVIDNAVSELSDAGLIYRRGQSPNVMYEFKHALVQDAAYQALLKRKRQQYHQAIAQALERQFPATSDTQPELIAHHYTEAGVVEQAIHYWHRAGQRAVQRSGNVEAVAHLTKGIELVKALKDTRERAARELELYLTLGPALLVTRGFAEASVGQAYARAAELCVALEDTAHLPLVLRGRQLFHLIRGELNKAQEFAKQFLDLVKRQQDPALLVGGYHALGQTLFFHGDLVAARRTVEEGIARFNPERHRLRNWPGGRPGEQCYLYAAFALWMLGFPDQALRRSEEALALAEELANLANIINTLGFVATVHVLRRDLAAAQQRAKATMEMSAEQRNPAFLAFGTIFHGWARTARDQFEGGIAEIHQGIATFRTTGAQTWLPYFLGLQAETYGRVKRPDDGLALVTEALTLADKTEQGCWQAELHRIKGELLLPLSSGNQVEAERCFIDALEIARRQEAKSWELRAATSLARLWRDQGKRKQGHDFLAPIYGWFTEGFETSDLKDAKALLDELA